MKCAFMNRECNPDCVAHDVTTCKRLDIERRLDQIAHALSKLSGVVDDE